MAVIDSTSITLAASGATVAPDAAAPPAGEKPAGEVGDKGKEGKPAEEARPESTDLINGILDKHGLSSPEELADFVDRIAELEGQIGDNDPDELLKAKTTLDAYQREWAKQEEAKKRASETPEQTIERLEKERLDRDNKAVRDDRQRRQAEAAKKAVKTYADVVGSTISAEKIEPELAPFVKEYMGVGSAVYDLNIQDRAAVKKTTKDAIKRVQAIMDLGVKRYLAGKQEIPKVPSGASETTPVKTDAQPKNLKEAGEIAKQSLMAILGKR